MFELPGRPVYKGLLYVADRKLVGLICTAPVPPEVRPPAPVRPGTVVVPKILLLVPPVNELLPPLNDVPPPLNDVPPLQ